MGVERESQIVAVFDTVGNGAVFNEDGATRSVTEKNFPGIFNYCRSETPSVQIFNYFRRLSYNQVGGIWRDNHAGLPVTWKWNADEKESIVDVVYEVNFYNFSNLKNFKVMRWKLDSCLGSFSGNKKYTECLKTMGCINRYKIVVMR